jgi:hypothetical protein
MLLQDVLEKVGGRISISWGSRREKERLEKNKRSANCREDAGSIK